MELQGKSMPQKGSLEALCMQPQPGCIAPEGGAEQHWQSSICADRQQQQHAK